ncbi:hypothetical protein HAX54_035266 [Datura stramonium]|uniref:Uncharacterized protein n=1 Tax=Datura stramonium TaxID=4076 RepID=A0ABS8VIC0_DATST|nr:hypothetical protein [Datura stramonium]
MKREGNKGLLVVWSSVISGTFSADSGLENEEFGQKSDKLGHKSVDDRRWSRRGMISARIAPPHILVVKQERCVEKFGFGVVARRGREDRWWPERRLVELAVVTKGEGARIWSTGDGGLVVSRLDSEREKREEDEGVQRGR